MKIGKVEYMTTAEAAEILGVSPRTAREIMRACCEPVMLNPRLAMWRKSGVRSEARRRERKRKGSER